jgi:hypothetical protein
VLGGDGGWNAADAAGMEAEIVVVDRNIERLRGSAASGAAGWTVASSRLAVGGWCWTPTSCRRGPRPGARARRRVPPRVRQDAPGTVLVVAMIEVGAGRPHDGTTMSHLVRRRALPRETTRRCRAPRCTRSASVTAPPASLAIANVARPGHATITLALGVNVDSRVTNDNVAGGDGHGPLAARGVITSRASAGRWLAGRGGVGHWMAATFPLARNGRPQCDGEQTHRVRLGTESRRGRRCRRAGWRATSLSRSARHPVRGPGAFEQRKPGSPG